MANDWRSTVDAVLELQSDEDIKTEPGPSLQWYPVQWLGDTAVQLMDWQAQGIHHHLLMIAWKGFDLDEDPVPCSIPDDPELIGDLMKVPDWAAIWRQVRRGWKAHKGRLWSVGLCRSYLDQMKRRRTNTASANARWEKAHSAKDANASGFDAFASKRHAKNESQGCSSPSPSPSPSAAPREKDTERFAEAAKPPNGGNGKPKKWEAEIAEIFDEYQVWKQRWYGVLQRPLPRKTKLTDSGRKSILKALRAGHTVEDIREALGHVENDSWLMGKTERCQSPQLTISAVLKIRPNGMDRIDSLRDKTKPDPAMAPLIDLHDSSTGWADRRAKEAEVVKERQRAKLEAEDELPLF